MSQDCVSFDTRSEHCWSVIAKTQCPGPALECVHGPICCWNHRRLPFICLSAIALFQLTGRDPHAAAPIPFIAVAIGWGGAFGIAAGYVSAKIARHKETQHA